MRLIIPRRNISDYQAAIFTGNHIYSQNIQGISLSLEQYNALIELLPQIETALKGKGEDVSRPDYNDDKSTLSSAIVKASPEENANDETSEDAGHDGQKLQVHASSKKLDKSRYSKQNHEATSDEEE